MNDLPVSTPARFSRANFWLALLALLIALFAALLGWRQNRAGEAATQNRTELNRELDALNQRIQLLGQNVQANERRLRDLEGVQKSLREEVLGVGQRATMIEGAVAGLAGRQMNTGASLILNEAEFLLRMGGERMRLFGDVGAAITAYELAEAQLASLNNPQLTGVRQSIQAEAKLLREYPLADVIAIANQLDGAREAVPGLRLSNRAPGTTVTPSKQSHWYDRGVAVFSDLLRVRKIDGDNRGLLGPLHVSAARSAITVDLLLAKAAMVEHDATKVASALARIESTLRDGFDVSTPEAKRILAATTAAKGANALPPLPEIGRSLDELDHLRTTLKVATTAASAGNR